MNNGLRRTIDIAAAVFAAAAVICTAVTLTVLFRPLYYWDIEQLDIERQAGLSAAQIRENYDALIDYNLLGGPEELVFPDLPMSEQGRIHFAEVKEIFIAMQVIALAAVFLLALWLCLRLRGRRPPCGWMRMSGFVAAAVALVTGAAVLIDWDFAFTTMHRIFFRNDYWIFDAETDPVIRMLPEEFFLHCGLLIILLVLLQIAALQIAYRRLKHE